MAKGISPLVASVLLIAITMAIAAVLATWVSGITQQAMAVAPTCIGGDVNYVTADYPKFESGGVKAVIEGSGVSLGNFRFDVLFNNDTSITVGTTGCEALPPGPSCSITTGNIGLVKSEVRQVRVTTNCSNVKTDWAALR